MVMAFASEPERKVAGWLRKRQIPYDYQVGLMGGRYERGGAVGDFVLFDRLPQLVIRVQGDYWHGIENTEARDEFQKVGLINAGYDVVDIWERRINENLDRVMKAAVNEGEELGP